MKDLYTQDTAAYASVRTLLKDTRIPVSMVRHYLYSKGSLTTLLWPYFVSEKINAFAGWKKEKWSMDLADVDKLAKENNGVKYFLVRQDLFFSTVDAK